MRNAVEASDFKKSASSTLVVTILSHRTNIFEISLFFCYAFQSVDRHAFSGYLAYEVECVIVTHSNIEAVPVAFTAS